MTDLAAGVLQRLGLHPAELAVFGGDIERWLAFLGEDQPWLGESENLKNRALYFDVVDAIYSIIAGAESEAMGDLVEPPSWVKRMAWDWSHNRSSIATFNYDQLVERLLRDITRWGTSLDDYYTAPLRERVRPRPSGLSWPREPKYVLPRLYKLHGSLNWMHGGENSPSTDELILLSEKDRELRMSGETRFTDLRPMIVPPASTKSRFYGRTALMTQWKGASAAITSSTELVLIGYSFPVSDVSTLSFISSSLPESVVLTVVDPNAEIADRVNALFPRNAIRNYFPSVREYVESTAGDLIALTTDRIEKVETLRVNGETKWERAVGDEFVARDVAYMTDQIPGVEYLTHHNDLGVETWNGYRPRLDVFRRFALD